MTMNSGSAASSVQTTSTSKPADSAKLVSLLALAAGAAAMPQSADAGIIYTNMSSSPVTVGYSGVAQFSFNLPGTVQFGFTRQNANSPPTSSGRAFYYRSVVAGKIGGAASAKVHVTPASAGSFIVAHAKGDLWNGQSARSGALVGTARQYLLFGTPQGSSHTPGTYSGHKYRRLRVQRYHPGRRVCFGWAEIYLTNSDLGVGTAPNVLPSNGYAYDDTGAFIAAGDTTVPEPSSTAFLAVGVLVLGSKGVRALAPQSGCDDRVVIWTARNPSA